MLNGFSVVLVTVEVGARRFVIYESFCHTNKLLGSSRRDLFNLLSLVDVAKVTIKTSFRIRTHRNCWSDLDDNSNTGS